MAKNTKQQNRGAAGEAGEGYLDQQGQWHPGQQEGDEQRQRHTEPRRDRTAILAEAEAAAAEARARVLQQLPDEGEDREIHNIMVMHGIHNQDGVTYEKGATFPGDIAVIERLEGNRPQSQWEKFKDLGDWDERTMGPVRQVRGGVPRHEQRGRDVNKQAAQEAEQAREKGAQKERERAQMRQQSQQGIQRHGPTSDQQPVTTAPLPAADTKFGPRGTPGATPVKGGLQAKGGVGGGELGEGNRTNWDPAQEAKDTTEQK